MWKSASRQTRFQSAEGPESFASSFSSQASLAALAASGRATGRSGRRTMPGMYCRPPPPARGPSLSVRRPGVPAGRGSSGRRLERRADRGVPPPRPSRRGVEGGIHASPVGEELVVRGSADLDEALPGGAPRLAHPGAREEALPAERGRLVLDLMVGHDPEYRGAQLRAGGGLPVRRRRVLHPADVDDVVHVSLALVLRPGGG